MCHPENKHVIERRATQREYMPHPHNKQKQIFIGIRRDMCELARSVVCRGTLLRLCCCMTTPLSTIMPRKDTGFVYLGAQFSAPCQHSKHNFKN